MKHLFISLTIITMTSVSALAGVVDTTATDTVVDVERPHRIVITERSDNSMNVDVNGCGNSKNFRYSYSTKQSPASASSAIDGDNDYTIPFFSSLSASKSSTTKGVRVEWFESLGMHFGFTHMSGASDACNMGNSIELGFLKPISMAVVFPHSWRMSTGVGFGWKNYRLNNNLHFTKDDSGLLSLAGYEDDTYNHLSRLKIFYLDVPVLLKKSFGKLSVCTGAVLNFNVYGSILTRFSKNEMEFKTCDEGVNQQKVTVDLMAAVQFFDIGLYVKYSPCNVLKSNNIPKFRSFSVGFALGI